MRSYLFLALALVLNAIANILIKVAMTRRTAGDGGASEGLVGFLTTLLSPVFVAGVLCFGLNLLLYSLALKKIALSVAYPIMVSLGYLIIVFYSRIYLREHLSGVQYVGAALIIAGVWLIVRSPQVST